MKKLLSRSGYQAFNRTFVELKFGASVKIDDAGLAFNRTFVELKSPHQQDINAMLQTFNRTFVELKSQRHFCILHE